MPWGAGLLLIWSEASHPGSLSIGRAVGTSLKSVTASKKNESSHVSRLLPFKVAASGGHLLSHTVRCLGQLFCSEERPPSGSSI